VEANNGQDAWDAIERDPSISVVITDIEMPIMNGWKLLERIRGSVQFKDIPVLVITGSGTKEEVLAAGANAFMSKPIDEGFFTVVDELFSKAP
jgi:two-component system chemotaxis response regulator CheY